MIEHILAITSLISWRDCIEILFFSATLYSLSKWIKKDRQKNLLPYLYAYCFLVAGSYFLHCATITFVLITFAPAALMMLFMMHQQTLQKNFITLNNITPRPQLESDDWLELLLRASLMTLNNNKNVAIVIERADSLQEFLSASLQLNTTVHKDLLTLMFESSLYDSEKIMWLNAHGKLIGMNGTWHMVEHDEWLSTEVKKVDAWQQKAIFVSSKTDALIIKMIASKKIATVCIGGKVIDNINTSQLLRLVKEYIQHTSPAREGELYGTQSKPRHHQPRT
jgi:hypothetical protein